jgi:hypothetical protein
MVSNPDRSWAISISVIEPTFASAADDGLGKIPRCEDVLFEGHTQTDVGARNGARHGDA